jgi:hypothetical protein
MVVGLLIGLSVFFVVGGVIWWVYKGYKDA